MRVQQGEEEKAAGKVFEEITAKKLPKFDGKL